MPNDPNEIFAVASSKVVEEMVFKADELYVFVVAHESTDVSGKKQLSIVLRHIKAAKCTITSFAEFVEIDLILAEAILSSILAPISRMEVDFQKLVGQGYIMMRQQWQIT